MKNYFGFAFLVLIICVALMTIVIKSCIDDTDKLRKEHKLRYDTLLTKSILSNKDTLVIVDYSMWEETVRLSNGSEVNVLTAEKLLLKK